MAQGNIDSRLKAICSLLVALIIVLGLTSIALIVNFYTVDNAIVKSNRDGDRVIVMLNPTRIVEEKKQTKALFELPEDPSMSKETVLKEKIDLINISVRTGTLYDFMRYANPRISEKTMNRIMKAVSTYCEKYGTSKPLIYALIYVESRYHYGADSFLGEIYGRGLCQVADIARKDFNLWTGKQYTADDMYIIEKNIEVALWAYNQNFKYGVKKNSSVDGIMAYNVGAAYTIAHRTELLNNNYEGRYYSYHDDVLAALNAISTYF